MDGHVSSDEAKVKTIHKSAATITIIGDVEFDDAKRLETTKAKSTDIFNGQSTVNCDTNDTYSDEDDASIDSVEERWRKSQNLRVNPFDRVSDTDEWQQDVENIFTQAKNSAQFDKPMCNTLKRIEIPHADKLGIEEDYFAQPEDLQSAVNNCKLQILELPEGDRRKDLIQKLVQLRMRIADIQDENDGAKTDGIKNVLGHRFKEKNSKSSKHYCEKCNTGIWGVLQTWFRCIDCGYNVHEKCINLIFRSCASKKAQEEPVVNLSICPDKGLAAQNYLCFECRAFISFRSGGSEPRLCDYSGRYYCEMCHWNDVMAIPARILHNWDFVPRKVCRASKQFLRAVSNKACIRVQDVNPMLFSFVEELNEVRKLRDELLVMKRYFLSCKTALEEKLLLQLKKRQHFVEASDMYSLNDLHDVATDVMLTELAKIHSSFAQHIKTECQFCQSKGYICELCDLQEILFPFDNIATVCCQCSTVLHRHCYMQRNRHCPNCAKGDQGMVEIRPS